MHEATAPVCAAPAPAAVSGPVQARSLAATALVCALLLAVLAVLVSHLTQGGQAWTFEALRRMAAANGTLRAPSMDLRDAQGQTMTLFSSAKPGDPLYLLDFIYTRCPTVCQALGSEYQRMQEALRHSDASVRLLSVSIDPLNDRQNELAGFSRTHKADPALWTVAAPRSESEGQAARLSLGVISVPDGFGGYVHNGEIHLVESSGRVLAIYSYEHWRQALAEAKRLASAKPSRWP